MTNQVKLSQAGDSFTLNIPHSDDGQASRLFRERRIGVWLTPMSLTLPQHSEPMDLTGPFLGVARSVRGREWRERLSPGQRNLALAIAQTLNVPEILGRVLAARDVSVADAASHLDPTLKNLLPDPHDLQDMAKAAARVADAIMGEEQVVVFGDYDVDGATSSALLHRFFAAHGRSLRIYIPDRMTEGYGPNEAAIAQLVNEGAKLIITVDCGITSFAPLALAESRGCHVVVVDHHQAEAELPAVQAVVNPNRPDDLSGQGHLAAAGVVFLLLVAVVRELRRRGWYGADRPEPQLLAWLDLVALATVCDVVPLRGLNRAFVAKGLQVLAMGRNLGLRHLAEKAGLTTISTPYHLGFILGPRINAGGRIGDASLGARLLATDDPAEAAHIAERLEKLNAERRALENQMLAEAMAQADRILENAPDQPYLLLAAEGWHKGIVGLMAGRLTERYDRPSLVIGWEGGGLGTGSARSVPGMDIGAAIRAAHGAGLLVKGGGHAMAAGFTLSADNLPAFDAFLSQWFAQTTGGMPLPQLAVDGALTAGGATLALMDWLDRAGPYGEGNPEPCFVLPAHRVRFAKPVGENHVRCSLMAGDGSTINAIAFRAKDEPLGQLLLDSGGLPIHVAGHLKRDSWRGQDRVDFVIRDAAKPQRPAKRA